MNKPASFDENWEKRYQAGLAQRYPWDVVVTFVFRNAPKDLARAQVRIFEIGCGTGSNLWFAAREGFQVAGLDGSPAAIAGARRRFAEDGLAGDFHEGDFTALPFPDGSFHLAIDRAALTYCDDHTLAAALAELHRILVPGGRCLVNVYADSHSSYRTGTHLPDGITAMPRGGTLAGTAATRFWSRGDIDRFFATGWRILSVTRLELSDMLAEKGDIHAEWRIVVEKS